jgi:electron transfer flavoprotein alpha subunit
MRIAVLVKQIPAFEEMELLADGHLRREGLDLEMSAFCRRAVSEAVELAAGDDDAHVVFATLGPPSAEAVLREALAWAIERGADAEGVLITDPAFAGSDTYATVRTIGAALGPLGPFDLVLTGRNSLDADTGQVGPGLAALWDLPFVAGVRELAVDADALTVRAERDDGWMRARVALPAIVSTAERLIAPCKVDAAEYPSVPDSAIRRLGAGDLGTGPWGAAGSPTSVERVRSHAVARERLVLSGTPEEQVNRALAVLHRRGALDRSLDGVGRVAHSVAPSGGMVGPAVAVLVEPQRSPLTSPLLAAAARLAFELGGHVVALTSSGAPDLGALSAQGADLVVVLDGARVEEDVAEGVAAWLLDNGPVAIALAASTTWGREVMARLAVRVGAGLTGDAIELELGPDRRLVAAKPAFGGQLVAEIATSSPMQMATVRPGVLPAMAPRTAGEIGVVRMVVEPRGRLVVSEQLRDDDLEVLADAPVVVTVGAGVEPGDYGRLQPLLDALGAELGASRKVTDAGALPHSRQIGITGRTVAPRLYVAVGVSGKYNHMVGARAAGTVLAINPDPAAPVFESADVGIVAPWQEVVERLVAYFAGRGERSPATVV